jgi:tetratricopeptide (TPR) repeat protein
MSKLVRGLIEGVSPRDTAALAGKILGRKIPLPKGAEKKTGAALEAEQATFTYIFMHTYLPILRLALFIAAAGFSLLYLIYQFIYIPLKAESIYQIGLERIYAGEYNRAKERFLEAFRVRRVKNWFFRYAEAFRDERQYSSAEEKYDELLANWPRDKKGVLDYAALETNYLRNYAKADSLIRRNILDYSLNDRDALLALGDNALAWAEIEPERYEDARDAYAKIMQVYGESDPVLERMLKYFIRTDNLREVLPLQDYFMGGRRKIGSATLAELGGYLLDKRFEKVQGVPNAFLDNIGGIREVLLRAIEEDPDLPESYYHLARYYRYFENPLDEQYTLERAIEKFKEAPEETIRRVNYHIDSYRRYGEILTRAREFFAAENQLRAGAKLYEEGLARRIIQKSPWHGSLYADLGDIIYFTQDGNMEESLEAYGKAMDSGYAPPEMLYRMGSAHYSLKKWEEALKFLFAAASDLPLNRRILYALGNTAYLRGDYFAAQAYYDRLLGILENDMARIPLERMPPTQQTDIKERLMVAQNNLGVTLEALTARTGNNSYRSRAFGLYAESERAWDSLTRDPVTMNRLGPLPGESGPGVNPAYLNVQNALHPVPGYEPNFFYRIDKDASDTSLWDELAPQEYRLSQGL